MLLKGSNSSLIFYTILIILTPLSAKDTKLVDYVDPFIGTTGGGNTFPGAVNPWGMVSVSPHNSFEVPTGYDYGQEYFFGFGHNHLSGTGCAELGCVVLSAVGELAVFDPDDYKTTYRNETASPGFYRTDLIRPDMSAEVTASERCGITRFIAQSDGYRHILIDAGRNLNGVMGGSVNLLAESAVSGYAVSGGFCGEENRKKVFFYALVDHKPLDRKIWLEGTTVKQDTATSELSVGVTYRYFMEAGDTLLVKVGLSYVSVENARLNLQMEIPNWEFDQIHQQARVKWEKALSRILVEGGREADFIRFYSAIYHMLIHPGILNDVNGEYPLAGNNGTGKVSGMDRYTVFSLWDTYRTLHPFMILIYPEIQTAMVNTMLDFYSESGWLPKWELLSNETYMMVGYPAAIVIADSYLKGLGGFDTKLAWQALMKPIENAGTPAGNAARPGYGEYLHYGYIPAEQDWSKDWWVWGPVSTNLEYNLADWHLARMGERLGKPEAKQLDKYAANYRNLFDPGMNFIRPRSISGDWFEPFDPLATEGSGDWEGSGGPGYVEGNAWNYTWFVPHDVPGLIDLFGGSDQFEEKLMQCFDEEHFTINNEPDMAYPYLFTYLPGSEYHTRRLVREIMEKEFTTGPAGLPGNDDCGTISGWFVFSALGFYPDCPGSGEYRLGEPLFNRAVIQLDENYYPGKIFTVKKEATSSVNTVNIKLNGNKHNASWISHNDIIKGGLLEFESKK